MITAYIRQMIEKTCLKRGDLRDALISYATDQTEAGQIETMSLRAAARDLGVSSGAVYRHFADKEALMIEIVQRGFTDMRARFIAIRPEGQIAKSVDEAITRAYALGEAYMRYAIAHPTLWRLMFGRIGCLCRDCHPMEADVRCYTMLDVAAENCRDLFRLGALSAEPDLQDTRFMWSALHGAADLAQSGARLDTGTAQEIAQETVTRSLLALGCPAHLLANWR